MSKPLILGVSGVAGSGKDTVAEFIAPLGLVRVAFADPLKRIARDVYDFSQHQLWGPSAERNKPDPRYPRQHTWVKSGYDEATCPCCGQTLTEREVEDGVFVTNSEDVSPCFLTPRYALQLLGTDWGRHCYEDTWVDKCLRTARQLIDGQGSRYSPQVGIYPQEDQFRIEVAGVAITDVRFGSEVRRLREAGAKVLRVVRPGAGLKGATGLHASEAEMATLPDSLFDAVVVNDGTLDDLRTKALAAVEALR